MGLDLKQIFKALPHVNEIWVKGNEFNLHPRYGGEMKSRESVTGQAEDPTVTADKAVIAQIMQSTTEEDVRTLVPDNASKAVADAAEKKIAALKKEADQPKNAAAKNK